jgi:hypothetical protein
MHYRNTEGKAAIRYIVTAVSALLVLSGISPASANEASFDSFSALSWRNAPSQDPQNWSRESLLAGLPKLEQLRQQDRATIIARLGLPGNSDELYTPGMGRHARLDIYRLSAKNDRVLRLDYDAQDRIESDEIEASSCGCPRCSEALPDARAMVTIDALARTVLKEAGPYPIVMTKGQVENLLGHAGRSYAMIEQVGGQAWTDYGETWRITGAAQRFFIASGELTVRDRAARQDGQLPITDYAIVTVGPNCPSR